ncbi:methyltransferase domain-containing protein [Desertihabitans brevis]|uniref:Methyltransferase domain-containing protein n=1 Tax=Desertihabitans brevis TaxID=2268447 RepID=A0A367Z0H2_9ACTN|nr:methyltransferase domain-containing protein [Desertihabitans brevis]RCK71387.1 methyltransferase domain-containing protein [Desertihabitans brevis]
MSHPASGHRYTHGHAESVLRSHRWRTAENSAAYLLDRLRPGLSLLDVGAGPGTLTADLAERVAPGPVTALEATPAALEVTRAGLAGRGVAAELVVGDVHALDLPDDTFDVVHAHQVLQHVADPVRALAEMARVARPGGVVAVRDSDYAAFTWWPRLPELDAWMALYQRVARANGGEPDAGRRLHAWAREAGLTRLQVGSSTWCFATPEDRAWWGGMWADRVTASAMAEQAVADGHATPADLERIADGWRAWAGHPDGWISLLHGEVLAEV